MMLKSKYSRKSQISVFLWFPPDAYDEGVLTVRGGEQSSGSQRFGGAWTYRLRLGSVTNSGASILHAGRKHSGKYLYYGFSLLVLKHARLGFMTSDGEDAPMFLR